MPHPGANRALIGFSRSSHESNALAEGFRDLTGHRPTYRGAFSAANALRTSDCDSPNCRAIREGVTPALNAARTAFTCPRVSECGVVSARLWRRLSANTGVCLPRRFCSVRTAVSSRSKSRSSRCLIALGKSLGKTCRCNGELADEDFAEGGTGSRDAAGANRSGIDGRVPPLAICK